MADYNYNHNRSKSYGGPNMMQLQPYYGPPPPQSHSDLRCYSASYAQTDVWGAYSNSNFNRDLKLKKGKSTSGSTSKSWSFSDPELQRKKRVASYKMYAVEGKVKGSVRKSFRWLKDRFSFSLK